MVSESADGAVEGVDDAWAFACVAVCEFVCDGPEHDGEDLCEDGGDEADGGGEPCWCGAIGVVCGDAGRGDGACDEREDGEVEDDEVEAGCAAEPCGEASETDAAEEMEEGGTGEECGEDGEEDPDACGEDDVPERDEHDARIAEGWGACERPGGWGRWQWSGGEAGCKVAFTRWGF